MNASLKGAVAYAISLRNPEAAASYLRDCPDTAEGESSAEEINHQNRYWRRQLENAGESNVSIEAREYLVDGRSCSVGEWLRLFHTGLLPAIISLALPRVSVHVHA